MTDLALTSPLLTHILNGRKAGTDAEYCLTTIGRLALAFFDCHLKGKGGLAPQVAC